MTEPTANDPASLPANVSLRPEEGDDEAFLYALYAGTREEELNATGWDEATRQAFLRMQFTAQRQGYRCMFPDARFLIILRGGTRAGRLVVNHAANEVRLVDIALLPAFQNLGIGARLVGELIAEAKANGKPVCVSVFKPSRAAAFYQRLGFAKTGEAGLYDLWEWRASNALTPPG